MSDAMVFTWLGLALLLVVSAATSWQLWLLPSLLFRGVRLAAEPGVSDWDTHPPPPEVALWLAEIAASLEARGFKAGRRIRVNGELATSVVWRQHLRHTKDRTRAAVSAWFLAGDDGLKPVVRELTLQVEAAKGRTLLLTTGDDVDDSLWPRTLVTVVLPGERDIDVVLACFGQRLAELGPDLPRARKQRHDGVAEAAARRRELFDHQAELGLLKLDESEGEWRLTWTGACMNAFYQFWPLRRRAVRRQRREAARLRRQA